MKDVMKNLENTVSGIFEKFQKSLYVPLILNYELVPNGIKENPFITFKVEVRIEKELFLKIRFCRLEALKDGFHVITQNAREILIATAENFSQDELAFMLQAIIRSRQRGLKNELNFEEVVNLLMKKNYLPGLMGIKKANALDDMNKKIDFLITYKVNDKATEVPLQLKSSEKTRFLNLDNVPRLIYRKGYYHSGVLAEKLYKLCEGYIRGEIKCL